MKHPPPTQAYGPTINRISDVMAHTDRYAFGGVTKLAADARVSPSSVSRLVHGKLNPSFNLVARVTTALEETLGYPIDPCDLVSELGKFLTPHTCDLAGCQRGCLPESATDEFGNIKSAFEGVKPGHWVTSRYPKGYISSQKGNL
jgi:transcriptional regulator with XRE-family HTH domain